MAQGKVHMYLGMMLDFTTDKDVKVTMIECVLPLKMPKLI